MLLARICRMKYNIWNPIFLIPLIGLVHEYWFADEPLLDSDVLFWHLLALLAVVYLHFVYDVVTGMARHLGISVFRITRKTKAL